MVIIRTDIDAQANSLIILKGFETFEAFLFQLVYNGLSKDFTDYFFVRSDRCWRNFEKDVLSALL